MEEILNISKSKELEQVTKNKYPQEVQQLVSEALNIVDKEESGNPQQKYIPGSIKEYKNSPLYIETAINKLRGNILEYYNKAEEKINSDKNSNFKPNPKDFPNGYLGDKNNT